MGMRDGLVQWTIFPAIGSGFATYTTASTGDITEQIDRIIWSAPYDPADPSTLLTWDNKIDNLHVTVTVP